MGDVKLYGITGLYEVKDQGNFCFGGYFKLDSETGRIFEGKLVDYHGTSNMVGMMSDVTLAFRKSYPSRTRNREFDYEFRLKDNGLWLGEWKEVVLGEMNGKTGCVIQDCGFDQGGLETALTSRQGTFSLNVENWAFFIREARGRKR